MTGAECVFGFARGGTLLRFFADFTITTRKEFGIIFDPDLKMLCEPLAESGKPNLVRKILFF